MPTPAEPPPDPQLDALLAEAGWVLALAKRLARDQAAAEDIAQSTLALALERRPSVEGSLRPWLAKVVGRLARRTIRSDVRRLDREAQAAPQRGSKPVPGDEVLERFELQQDLARRVGALPEPYRGVLIRRYYEGLSVKEIARATGVSSGTVRSQLARGLERVRLQYDHDPEGRSALGVFLIASGSTGGFVSRSTAQIVTMQTSTKVVTAAAAVLAATALIAVIGPGLGRRERLEPDGVAPIVQDELASVGSDGNIEVVPPDGSDRIVAESDPLGVAAEPQTLEPEEDAAPPVSTVRARIIDQDRKPLAGATLGSVHRNGRARGTDSTAQSDSAGRVVLELADSSMRSWEGEALDMLFAAGAAGHVTEFVSKQPRMHGEVDLGDIRLGPGGALVGTVVDVDGRAIAGAALYAGASVITEDPETMRFAGPNWFVPRPQAVSAADGSFELSGISAEPAEGRASGARIWAHARGRLWTITEPFTISPGGRVDIGQVVLEEVQRELRIEGVVVRPDGLPAAGARVEVMPPGGPHEAPIVADVRGHFLFVPWREGPVDLVAQDASGELGRSSTLIAERGELVELMLKERRVLSVTVIDSEGEPIADAHLLPALVGGAFGDGRLIPGVGWSTSDESGRIEIDVPGWTFQMEVKRAGFGTRMLGPFEPDSAPETLVVTLPRRPKLSGRVLAYGEPVAGARVFIAKWRERITMTDGFPNRFWTGNRPSVTTDSEGRFSTPYDPEWFRLPVVARLEGMASGEVILDVPPEGSAREVEIHLTEGGAIEGAVKPPPGRAAAGLYVAASRGDGLPISTKVDADGRYRFEGLTPGEWRVEGRLQGVSTEMLFAARHPDDREFRWNALVVDRATLEFDVDMRHLGDVEVRGQLRIDGLVPPSGWTAEAVPPLHERWRSEASPVRLDSDGRFAFITRPGRADLRLVGPVPGGATVELLREVRLQGPRFEWEEALKTAFVLEFLEGSPERARFVRGALDEGDRELTLVPVGEDGSLQARVPVGSSSLQVPAEDSSSEELWESVLQVEIR